MSGKHIQDKNSVIVVNVHGSTTGNHPVFTIIEENETESLKLLRENSSLQPQVCNLKSFCFSIIEMVVALQTLLEKIYLRSFLAPSQPT